MRKDLQKQLCEQERHGSSRSYKEVRRSREFNVDYDEFVGGRESMTHRYRVKGIDKNLSENFAPLWGIIRTNAGRPWDKVYSELCEVFDMRNHVNAHIIVHLFDFVETKTFIGEDGEIWVGGRKYGKAEEPLKSAYCEYYVHPKNGLLLKNKHWKGWKSKYRYAKPEDPNVRVISKEMEFRRRDENSPWFVCTLRLLPLPQGKQVFRPFGLGRRPHQGYWVTEYPDLSVRDAWDGKLAQYNRYYCNSVKSASKKDLKKWGVV